MQRILFRPVAGREGVRYREGYIVSRHEDFIAISPYHDAMETLWEWYRESEVEVVKISARLNTLPELYEG